jgi:hypothetical protein
MPAKHSEESRKEREGGFVWFVTADEDVGKGARDGAAALVHHDAAEARKIGSVPEIPGKHNNKE